ncbi:MAG: molybdenum cofactor guanylyltransferase [Gemmatimonadota bacterium]|nr:molybdenum cofactor guanylyltransferase [Gemmatimonadota bacterium]
MLAGGASRRFGSPKAFARVGERRLVERGAEALRAAALPVGLVVADPAQAGGTDLPFRLDRHLGLGPLGGIDAALRWADEVALPGALCLACDLPFVPASLLRTLAEHGAAGRADVVLPASRGRWGWEPLCAFYSVRALPRVADAIRSGKRRIAALVESARIEVLPLDRVCRWGDPDTLFLNVNSPDDHRRAERIAASLPHPPDAASRSR